MKKLLFFILIITIAEIVKGQQNYCDFEGVKFISFGLRTGELDSSVVNPAPNNIDSSANCAKYVRGSVLYDNCNIHPNNILIDVSPYATDTTLALKIQMKIFTTASIGTIVQLQLGIKSDNTYPAGVHSEFIGVTTVRNEWELMTFDYLQSPSGSMATPTSIDKIVVFFNPNSYTRDTVYFDDLTGPEVFEPISVAEVNAPPAFKLYQNNPNPAKQNTHINFLLNSSGRVTLQLYDLLGTPISSILDQQMIAGNYSIPIETATIPNGIYFYVLKKEGLSKTMKMIVAK